MKKDATESGTTGSSLQCNVVGKKDHHYLEESKFIPRLAPKMQAIPKSSKLKHIQEGADW